MTNFFAALQALGEVANQAAAAHGPGFIDGARGFGQEAMRNFQQHAPAVANAAANFGQGVASHAQVHIPVIASAAVDVYQKHAPVVAAVAANVGQDIAKNAQVHGPIAVAAVVGAAGQAAKHVGEQVPFVMEHAAAAVTAGIGLLTATARKELEAKHPDIFTAIQKGWFVVIENAEKARCWAAENPGEVAIIVAGLILVVVPGVVTGPALHLTGFGKGGVAADSVAALVHSRIGNVAASSAFAILQSAGTGNVGLAVVNGVVQGLGVLALSGTALVSFLQALEEEKAKDQEKEKAGEEL